MSPSKRKYYTSKCNYNDIQLFDFTLMASLILNQKWDQWEDSLLSYTGSPNLSAYNIS